MNAVCVMLMITEDKNDLTGEGGLEQASEGVLTEALTASQEVLRTLLAD